MGCREKKKKNGRPQGLKKKKGNIMLKKGSSSQGSPRKERKKKGGWEWKYKRGFGTDGLKGETKTSQKEPETKGGEFAPKWGGFEKKFTEGSQKKKTPAKKSISVERATLRSKGGFNTSGPGKGKKEARGKKREGVT